MTISKVRSYFNAKFLETDTGFRNKEWKDAFNIDNIPATLIDMGYHIQPGELISTVKNDHTVEDDLNTEINIWFRGYRDVQEKLDESYDIVNEFRLRCLHHENFYDNTFPQLADVNLTTSIEPTFIETNDNTINYKLSFNVKLIQVPLRASQ